jgi:nitroreductase
MRSAITQEGSMKATTVWLFCCLALAGSAYAAEKVKGDEVISVIAARKSVRNFTGASVSKGDLEKVLRAGMSAPTAMNKQPWSFIVVTDRKKLDTLSAGLPSAKMLSKAGAAIIVCTDPELAIGKSKDYAVIDATLASENILLAVEALGLGALWTAAYPDTNRMNQVRTVLNIPQDIIPLNVIPVGIPTGEDKPKDKFKMERIHWEKW